MPFNDSVEEYVRLHRQVRASLPPLDVDANLIIDILPAAVAAR